MRGASLSEGALDGVSLLLLLERERPRRASLSSGAKSDPVTTSINEIDRARDNVFIFYPDVVAVGRILITAIALCLCLGPRFDTM